MKTKIFATFALLASMLLVGCGKKPCEKHQWGKWETTKEATCTVVGEQTRKCTVCGEKETKEIPLKEHTWDEGRVTQEATCSVPGKKVYTCTVCHEATKEEVILAEHDLQPVEHAQGEGEVAEEIKKCSKDAYYQFSFSAADANAQLNNASDKKSDGYVKLSKQVAADGTGTASYVEYKIYSPAALKGRFWIDITGNTSGIWDRASKSGSQALYYTYNDTTTNINTWKNKVELNGVEVDFDNAKYNLNGTEIPFAELEYADFGTLASSSGATISVPMPEMNLNEGVNTLRFTRLTGYAFNMHSFTFKTILEA